MEKKTYQNILETSKRLFNENGVRATTMRMIAEECDISVGNLTYYFAKKQQLVDAILTTSFQVNYRNVQVETFEDFESLIRLMVHSVQEHRFFLLDNTLKEYPQFRANIAYLYDILNRAIESMKKNGLIEIREEEKKALVSMFMLSPITWASTDRYFYKDPLTLDELVEQQMVLIRSFAK